MMADHLSTMENVIVSANCVQLQSSTNGATHSDTSSGQTDCTIDSNHSHCDAENIVSSTQEHTNETLNEQLNSERTISIVNKCDETNVKSTLLNSMASNEKQRTAASEESHISKTNTSSSSSLSSQSRKAMDESKHHLHITESSSSKIKSKPTDSG